MHDSTTVADIFSYSPLFQLPDSIIIFYGTYLETHSFQVEMKRVTVTVQATQKQNYTVPFMLKFFSFLFFIFVFSCFILAQKQRNIFVND
jgi:hypothetical protein